MLRSVRFYSIASPWPDTEAELAEKVAGAAFAPCTAFAERSSGFEPPTPEISSFARRIGGVDLVRLRTQTRLLPAAALNEALETRLAEYRDRMQQEPPRRVKRQLKEQTRDELLPKALLKSQRTTAVVFPSERVLAVGTASQARADEFIQRLRDALGKLEVHPLEFKLPFAELMAQLLKGRGPREFVIGKDCRMRDPSDAATTVRWQNVDLGEASVQQCLRDGMQVTHLGFEFGNAVKAVLDTNGVLSKLELPGLKEAAEDEGDDALSRLDAEITLFGGALRSLVGALRRTLGGSEAAPSAQPRIAPTLTVVGTANEPKRLREQAASPVGDEPEFAVD
jgi:recombination associated protein RdgC